MNKAEAYEAAYDALEMALEAGVTPAELEALLEDVVANWAER